MSESPDGLNGREDVPGSSMCANSHSIAASGSLFPVASSAFWQRTVGKPIASNCAMAASLNWGNPGAATVSVSVIFIRAQFINDTRTCFVVW